MTPDQLSAIRARLDAANTHAMSTQIEIDRDGTTRWINLGPFLCVSHDDAYQVRCLVTLMHYAPTDLRALLDEVERLTAERDDLLAWSQRFSDLVGVDGSTEAGRDDAFAKLYDAAKASGKLVKG
jgi:PAS domain-containing protein